ncbi:MAG: heavy metal translocating P-type ATPase [Gammaproteobacteria bacterium]|nr:MAG: heavy metal translocating P-type ATPase [Gammaproteobacteria bacterium]
MTTLASPATRSIAVASSCFHCGLSVPASVDIEVTVGGRQERVCCHGCEGAVQFIRDAGLDDFYRLRAAPSRTRPGEGVAADASAFADPDVAEQYMQLDASGRAHGDFALDGVGCAACAWVIEHGVRDLPGLRQARVDLASGRLSATWDADDAGTAAAGLTRLMARINALGFDAVPAQPAHELSLHAQQRRRSLTAIGIAGIGAMQVMMLAIADYAGLFSGMADDHRALVIWAQMVLTGVVVAWGAQPFFKGAVNTLRAGSMGIDVPVSLAIGLGWGVSTLVVLSGGIGRGEHVYFDSVAMFTFFLLLGRHLEQSVRHRFARADAELDALLPAAVTRLDASGGRASVLPASLLAGDVIEVPPGGIVAADGRVLEGAGEVDRAALTGESAAQRVEPGSEVAAGSRNGASRLRMEVLRPAGSSALAAIPQLLARARAQRPPSIHLADRLAGLIVIAVLAIAAVTAAAWMLIDPSRVLPVTLATLMVTCPCAFALATPVTLTAATLRLRRLGVLLVDPAALERAGQLRHAYFDKTGTLTEPGQLHCEPVSAQTLQTCIDHAVALERDVPHPIAVAMRRLPVKEEIEFDTLRVVPGSGVEGFQLGRRWRLGRPRWAASDAAAAAADPAALWLTVDGSLCATFSFEHRDVEAADEKLRPGAVSTLAAMTRRGLELAIVSGDAPERVGAMAQRLRITRWWGGVDPQRKYALLAAAEADGGVLYVGDGLNDAPALGRAGVAVATASACDFTRSAADAIVLDDRLEAVVDLLDSSDRTRRIIRQNLLWAISYNLLAMPLAVTGLIAPWAAAIGMSASSLLVIGNATRLLRGGSRQTPNSEVVAWT